MNFEHAIIGEFGSFKSFKVTDCERIKKMFECGAFCLFYGGFSESTFW